MRTLTQALCLVVALGAAGCSTDSFTGSTPSEAADTPPATATPPAPPPAPVPPAPAPAPVPAPAPQSVDQSVAAPQQCIQGDQVNFAWSGAAADCIMNKHQTYNFNLNECAQMQQASFTCNWKNVTDQLTERGLLTPAVQAAAANGAKLVSCGASQDGNRIVVQWIDLQNIDPSCSPPFDPNMITTGCYTYYTDSTPPPVPTDPQAQFQQVFACMNQL